MFDAWKQRQRQRLENRPERTVFYNIFATMMLVLVVELLMAVASILAVNVTGQLDENAKDLLTMRVRNRASYVQEILRAKVRKLAGPTAPPEGLCPMKVDY